MTVALKDKVNTTWADGTTADLSYSFVISHNKAKMDSDARHHWYVCSADGFKHQEEDHDFGKWVTSSQATKDKDGVRERVCQTCGYKETKTFKYWWAPITGDDSNINLFAGFVLLSMVGLAASSTALKKSRYHGKH